MLTPAIPGLPKENHDIKGANYSTRYDVMLIKIYYWMQIKMIKDAIVNASNPSHYTCNLLNTHRSYVYSISMSLLRHVTNTLFNVTFTTSTFDSTKVFSIKTSMYSYIDSFSTQSNALVNITNTPKENSGNIPSSTFPLATVAYLAGTRQEEQHQLIALSLITFLNIRIHELPNNAPFVNTLKNALDLTKQICQDTVDILLLDNSTYFTIPSPPLTSANKYDRNRWILTFAINKTYGLSTSSPPSWATPVVPEPTFTPLSFFPPSTKFTPSSTFTKNNAIQIFNDYNSWVIAYGTALIPGFYHPTHHMFNVTNNELKRNWELLYEVDKNTYNTNTPPFDKIINPGGGGATPFETNIENTFIEIMKNRGFSSLNSPLLSKIYKTFSLSNPSRKDAFKLLKDSTGKPLKIEDERNMCTFANLEASVVETVKNLPASSYDFTIRNLPNSKSKDIWKDLVNQAKLSSIPAERIMELKIEEIGIINDNWFKGGNKKVQIISEIEKIKGTKLTKLEKQAEGSKWKTITNGWKIQVSNHCWLCGLPVYYYCFYVRKHNTLTPFVGKYANGAISAAVYTDAFWNSPDEENLLVCYYDNNDEHILPPGMGNIVGTLLPTNQETIHQLNTSTKITSLNFGLLPSHATCNIIKNDINFINLPDGSCAFEIYQDGIDDYYAVIAEQIAGVKKGKAVLNAFIGTGIDPQLIIALNKNKPSTGWTLPNVTLQTNIENLYKANISRVMQHLCNYLNTGIYTSTALPSISNEYRKLFLCSKLKSFLMLVYIVRENKNQDPGGPGNWVDTFHYNSTKFGGSAQGSFDIRKVSFDIFNKTLVETTDKKLNAEIYKDIIFTNGYNQAITTQYNNKQYNKNEDRIYTYADFVKALGPEALEYYSGRTSGPRGPVKRLMTDMPGIRFDEKTQENLSNIYSSVKRWKEQMFDPDINDIKLQSYDYLRNSEFGQNSQNTTQNYTQDLKYGMSQLMGFITPNRIPKVIIDYEYVVVLSSDILIKDEKLKNMVSLIDCKKSDLKEYDVTKKSIGPEDYNEFHLIFNDSIQDGQRIKPTIIVGNFDETLFPPGTRHLNGLIAISPDYKHISQTMGENIVSKSIEKNPVFVSFRQERSIFKGGFIYSLTIHYNNKGYVIDSIVQDPASFCIIFTDSDVKDAIVDFFRYFCNYYQTKYMQEREKPS